MPMFTAPPDSTLLEKVTDGLAGAPEFADRYNAIKELREMSAQELVPSAADVARANGFFRVASMQGPLEKLMHLLDPNWMKDKKQFYKWLDGAGHKHCTYDRRKDRPRLTLVDGKVVR